MSEPGNDAMLPADADDRIKAMLAAERERQKAEQEAVSNQPVADDPE